MSERVKEIVSLAIDDKPNKASALFNDEMLDRIAPAIDVAKSVVSNNLFGQEYQEPEEDNEEDLHAQEYLDADMEDVDDQDLDSEEGWEEENEDDDEV